MKEKMTREEIVRQRNTDFLHSFSGPHGERVFEYLKGLSTYEKSSIPADKRQPIDVNRLIYDEGQRAVILHILHWLNVDITKLKKE